MIRIVLSILFQIITIIVIADVLVSYFLSPFHPVRKFLDQFVQPVLEPIRSLLPQTMMFDFSPVILIIIIEIIQSIVFRFL